MQDFAHQQYHVRLAYFLKPQLCKPKTFGHGLAASDLGAPRSQLLLKDLRLRKKSLGASGHLGVSQN